MLLAKLQTLKDLKSLTFEAARKEEIGINLRKLFSCIIMLVYKLCSLPTGESIRFIFALSLWFNGFVYAVVQANDFVGPVLLPSLTDHLLPQYDAWCKEFGERLRNTSSVLVRWIKIHKQREASEYSCISFQDLKYHCKRSKN